MIKHRILKLEALLICWTHFTFVSVNERKLGRTVFVTLFVCNLLLFRVFILLLRGLIPYCCLVTSQTVKFVLKFEYILTKMTKTIIDNNCFVDKFHEKKRVGLCIISPLSVFTHNFGLSKESF